MRNNRITFWTKILCALFAAALISGCVASEHDAPVPAKLTAKGKKAKGKTARRQARIVTHKSLRKKRKHKYFVEFRSRPNGVTSHSYLAYGRLYSRGRIRRVKLVGLHPKNGSAGFLIGSLVGMEAQLAPTWGDRNIPHTVSFRVPLTYKKYKAMLAFIKKEKKKKHVWNLVLNNCNGFIGQVARIVGLDAPGTSAVPPSSYVKSMIDLNT